MRYLVGNLVAGLGAALLLTGSMGRDVGVLVLRVLTGLPLGMAAVLLPLFAVNYAFVPLFWWALPDGETGGGA